jgi:hypothetical protein
LADEFDDRRPKFFSEGLEELWRKRQSVKRSNGPTHRRDTTVGKYLPERGGELELVEARGIDMPLELT